MSPAAGHLPMYASTAYTPPTLGMVIRDAEHYLCQAVTVLERQWDPTSGPQQDGGVLPSEVDILFGAARTEIRIALLHLGDIAGQVLPPAGSAVQYPARQVSVEAEGLRIATTGGPSIPPVPAGECRSPGSVAARGGAACESDSRAGASQAASFPATGSLR